MFENAIRHTNETTNEASWFQTKVKKEENPTTRLVLISWVSDPEERARI